MAASARPASGSAGSGAPGSTRVPIGVTSSALANPHFRSFFAAPSLDSRMPIRATMSVRPPRVAAPTYVRPACEVKPVLTPMAPRQPWRSRRFVV